MSFSANNYCPICGNWFYSSECPHNLPDVYAFWRAEAEKNQGSEAHKALDCDKSTPSPAPRRKIVVYFRAGGFEVHRNVLREEVEPPFYIVETADGERFGHLLDAIRTIVGKNDD
jgi:hypothetical protein